MHAVTIARHDIAHAFPTKRFVSRGQRFPAWKFRQNDITPFGLETRAAGEPTILKAEDLAIARIPEFHRPLGSRIDAGEDHSGDSAGVNDPQETIARIEFCRVDDAARGPESLSNCGDEAC